MSTIAFAFFCLDTNAFESIISISKEEDDEKI